MQKLCCVCTRQQFSASLVLYFVTSSLTHISTNSQPILVGIVSMDRKSPETMHMHYNWIYTMATTNGRKLLIWKLSKSKNIKCSKILERLSMKRTRSSMHQKGTKRSEYTLYLMSKIVENSRLDLLQMDTSPKNPWKLSIQGLSL